MKHNYYTTVRNDMSEAVIIKDLKKNDLELIHLKSVYTAYAPQNLLVWNPLEPAGKINMTL